MGHFPHLHLFFFYFFQSFFYLLPPTHSQPCRKTTGEIMFRVKGLWLCYCSCRGICRWELMARNKWQSHSINTLFLPFFLLILILVRVGCSLNNPGDLRQLTLLSLFMAVSRSVAICVARSLSFAIVEYRSFEFSIFFNVILFATSSNLQKKSCMNSTRRCQIVILSRASLIKLHQRLQWCPLQQKRPFQMLGSTQLSHVSIFPQSGAVLQSFLESHVLDLFKDYKAVIL